jgi:hypothetical protein
MKRMSDRMEDTLTTEVGLGRLLGYHLVATGLFTVAFVGMMLQATKNRNSDMVGSYPPPPPCPWLSRRVHQRDSTLVEGRLTSPLTDCCCCDGWTRLVQGLAGILALMALVGTMMGYYASWKRSTLFMSLVRTSERTSCREQLAESIQPDASQMRAHRQEGLYVCMQYACWQQMLVAVAAVFLMRVFDGLTKVTQFCALRSGAGLPDADCDMHELMALVRLAVGFLTVLVALTSSFITMLLRDLLVGAGTQSSHRHVPRLTTEAKVRGTSSTSSGLCRRCDDPGCRPLSLSAPPRSRRRLACHSHSIVLAVATPRSPPPQRRV